MKDLLGKIKNNISLPYSGFRKVWQLFSQKLFKNTIFSFVSGVIIGFSLFFPLWADAQIVEPGFESESMANRA